MLKYIASIPVVLSLLAATYGGINYVNKLNNTIDDNEDAIALLQVEIDNVYNGFGDEIDNIHQIILIVQKEIPITIQQLVRSWSVR